jgi:hypothetical protein
MFGHGMDQAVDRTQTPVPVAGGTLMAKSTPARLRERTKAFIAASHQVKAASDARGQHFSALAQPAVAKRLGAPETPFLGMIAWSKQTPPGGKLDLAVFVFNSDTNPMPDLYIHVWVGSGNIDPNVGTFLLNVDPRFPRLTRPEFPGLLVGDPHPFPLQPGNKRVNFSIDVPSSVEETVYMGNICLMQLASHNIGKYLGRAVFPFAVHR